MSRSGKKNYEKSETAELKETIRRLKADLRKQNKRVKILKSEIVTLQKAMNESTVYIDERLVDVPVDDIVKYFSDANGSSTKSLDGVQEAYEESQKKLKAKWECHKCDDGYMKMVIINRPDGKHYFRSCTNCDNRTNMKKYHQAVEES